ncbi:MAG: hypothetical protein J7J44_02590 [Deltaproteobacteria bacterium]|nr:hypothetical protein [Deltaproteobacteria bacterium]
MEKVKVYVYTDERYPFYWLCKDEKDATHVAEFTKEELEFIKKAMQACEKAQELIEEKIREFRREVKI